MTSDSGSQMRVQSNRTRGQVRGSPQPSRCPTFPGISIAPALRQQGEDMLGWVSQGAGKAGSLGSVSPLGVRWGVQGGGQRSLILRAVSLTRRGIRLQNK